MLRFVRCLVYLPCLLLLVSLFPRQAGATPPASIFHTSYFPVFPNVVPPSAFYAAKYKEWKLDEAGLSATVFNYAVKGYQYIKKHYALDKSNIITIVDFSKPSSEERLFTIDLETGEVIFKTLVAHGKNTGQQFATRFSNKASSLASSLGFYITKDTYTGNNGYSLRLQGCEKGFNDKALERNIVVHGADYVSERFIRQNGFLGRSHGCPAVPAEQSNDIINTIRNGSCLFVYHPDKKYLKQSHCINN